MYVIVYGTAWTGVQGTIGVFENKWDAEKYAMVMREHAYYSKFETVVTDLDRPEKL